MSLINDMLRDLEDKRPDDLARHNLQREIRPLPGTGVRSAHRLKQLGLLFGAGSLLLTAVLLQASGRLGTLFGGGPPAVPPAPAVAVPSAPPAVQPTAPIAAVDSENRAIFESLRLASELANVPAPPPEPLVPASPAGTAKAEPTPAAVETDRPAPSPSPVASPAPTPAATPNVAPVSTPGSVPAPAAGPVRIEKSPVLATPRDRAEAEYRKADAARATGHGAEALEGWRAALKIDPGFAPARQALVHSLLEGRQIEEAMAVLQAGLNEQPAQSAWAVALARLQLEAGDLAAADRTLARSQPYAEASAEYAGFQGHLKSRLGAQPMAVSHYQRATRLAPGEGRWWLGLGLALEADGQLPAAREAFRRSRATGTLSPDLAAIAEQHLR